MQYYEKQAIHYSAIKQFLKTDAIWSHCLGCGTLLPMTTQTLIFNSLYSNVKAFSRKHSQMTPRLGTSGITLSSDVIEMQEFT